MLSRASPAAPLGKRHSATTLTPTSPTDIHVRAHWCFLGTCRVPGDVPVPCHGALSKHLTEISVVSPTSWSPCNLQAGEQMAGRPELEPRPLLSSAQPLAGSSSSRH